MIDFNIKEYLDFLKKEISVSSLRDLHVKINDIIEKDKSYSDLITFMLEFEKVNWTNHKDIKFYDYF
jgi:hypothetical protein